MRLQKNEVGCSRNIPISNFVTPTVFETRDAMFGSTLKINGVAFDTADVETMARHKHEWHQALVSIGEEYTVYVTEHRRRQNIALQGEFTAKFARDFNAAYHQRFQNKKLFVKDIYITLVLKGHPGGKVGRGIQLFNRVSKAISELSLKEFRTKQIQKISRAIHQLCVDLKLFTPRLLGENDGSPEVLTFLGMLVNGGEMRKFSYPYQDIASYVATKRVFFGYDRTIQWLGNSSSDIKFGAVLSIKEFNAQDKTYPTMLDALMESPFEYITSHTFAPQNAEISKKAVEKQLIRLSVANDASISQQVELTEMLDLIASGKVKTGYHHHSLLVLADNRSELEDRIAYAEKIYKDAKLVIVREFFNMELAYWAQIPGNLKMIARKVLITSKNFVDYCPLHNYYTGYIDGNHLGSAVTLLETPARTPLFFNFHKEGSGSKQEKTLGITTIIAPSGAGKTTLQLALNCQRHRYGGRTFIFDRDRSSEIYVRAMGGFYGEFKPGIPTGLNPCQLPDTEQNRDFLRKLLAHLAIDPQENNPLNDYDHQEISRVVNANYDLLPHEQRNLSNLYRFFSVDFSGRYKLKRWLRGNETQKAGDYACWLDNETDTLKLYDLMGFDMTHLLDKEPRHVMQAMVMYLSHVIEKSLDGRLTDIIYEEGWQYLNNPYWIEKLQKEIPTLRKFNCFLILTTQLPQSVIDSPIGSQFVQNSATNIYLPNPHANEKHYMGSDGFNLSRGEFTFIKETTQKRQFLLKTEHQSAICTMDLSGLEEYLVVFSANPDMVKKVESIRKDTGDNPDIWLARFRESLLGKKTP